MVVLGTFVVPEDETLGDVISFVDDAVSLVIVCTVGELDVLVVPATADELVVGISVVDAIAGMVDVDPTDVDDATDDTVDVAAAVDVFDANVVEVPCALVVDNGCVVSVRAPVESDRLSVTADDDDNAAVVPLSDVVDGDDAVEPGCVDVVGDDTVVVPETFVVTAADTVDEVVSLVADSNSPVVETDGEYGVPVVFATEDEVVNGVSGVDGIDVLPEIDRVVVAVAADDAVDVSAATVVSSVSAVEVTCALVDDLNCVVSA